MFILYMFEIIKVRFFAQTKEKNGQTICVTINLTGQRIQFKQTAQNLNLTTVPPILCFESISKEIQNKLDLQTLTSFELALQMQKLSSLNNQIAINANAIGKPALLSTYLPNRGNSLVCSTTSRVLHLLFVTIYKPRFLKSFENFRLQKIQTYV